MTGYEVALFFHLLGVLLLAGGSTATAVLGIAASRTSTTRLIEQYTRLSATAERALIIPGAILLFAAGLWLVNEAGYGYGDGWLIAAYVIFAAAFTTGAFVLGPANMRVHARAAVLLAEGTEESEELQRMAAAPLIAALGMLEHVAIVVFLWLMIAKPGA